MIQIPSHHSLLRHSYPPNKLSSKYPHPPETKIDPRKPTRDPLQPEKPTGTTVKTHRRKPPSLNCALCCRSTAGIWTGDRTTSRNIAGPPLPDHRHPSTFLSLFLGSTYAE